MADGADVEEGGRPLGEVSLVEIGNAMCVVADHAGGGAVDDLKRDALAMFGGIRVTKDVGARLDEELEGALAIGALKRLPSGTIVVGYL